jgi:hypothetical protein
MLVDSKSASECWSVENVVQVEPVGEFELKGIRRLLAAYNFASRRIVWNVTSINAQLSSIAPSRALRADHSDQEKCRAEAHSNVSYGTGYRRAVAAEQTG